MPGDKTGIGSFYVELTAKLYGGAIQDNGSNNSDLGNPDILNWEHNQAYESKGSISSDHHKIQPKQIQHYQRLLSSDFPLTDPEAYYFLWQYSCRGINQFKGIEQEKKLVQTTRRLLVVSFEIIEAGTEVWDMTGSANWPDYYMLRSSERTKLTREPELALQDMHRDPGDYNISKETIPANSYKYKWWNLPEFTITSIIRKGMRGLERK